MYRSKLGRLLPLFILLSLVLPAGVALAAEEGSEFGVLTGVAFGDKNLVGEDKKDNPNLLLGLRYANLFADHWGFFIDGVFIPYNGVAAPGDSQEYAGRFGIEALTGPEHSVRWFVAGALGGMMVNPDNTDSFSRGLVSLGLGLRHPFSDRGSFRLELRGEQTVTDDGLGGDDLMNLHLILGWAWGGQAKDTDGDGVSDRKDKCPDTPSGATVDEKGCPKDTDGDGVYDGLDRCPDTPAGTPVDASGCTKDTDGDGVHDGIDACPNTPSGVKVDAKGCPLDSDGDGVTDDLDRCPNTPKGTRVDAKGCPVPLDSDGDGVTDDMDRCPNTPRGTKVDANGCPPVVPLFEEGKKTLVLEGVNFEYNKSVLTAEAKTVLDRTAQAIKDNPGFNIEIGGHTDSRGKDLYNLKLSADRARSVLRYLLDKGVDPARLTAKGYGETKPIADNNTDEGRAKNRRVELTKQD
jgi:outer membrane protein OmpA-like peptidoglycan-associated protein